MSFRDRKAVLLSEVRVGRTLRPEKNPDITNSKTFHRYPAGGSVPEGQKDSEDPQHTCPASFFGLGVG